MFLLDLVLCCSCCQGFLTFCIRENVLGTDGQHNKMR
jgi:hypothetical protein